MTTKDSSLFSLYFWAILVSFVAAVVIALTSDGLSHFSIVGPTVPFAYPWRLDDPTWTSRATAWIGYGLHNVGAWLIIALAQRNKTRIQNRMRWFNWSMLCLHVVFCVFHWLQTRLWYDGLAQDVPEVTALGSVALMLMIVLIIETPRRGLILGKKVSFQALFLRIVRKYHSYVFTWALIYTFWYHPMEDTPGHLFGFFYMAVLLGQSVFLFHRGHYQRLWKLSLELLVIPHGVVVALLQGNQLWPMFGFGFGAILVLTQMYAFDLSATTRNVLIGAFVLGVVATYSALGRLAQIHEVVRIPILDYAVVGLLYLLFRVGRVLFRPHVAQPIQSD